MSRELVLQAAAKMSIYWWFCAYLQFRGPGYLSISLRALQVALETRRQPHPDMRNLLSDLDVFKVIHAWGVHMVLKRKDQISQVHQGKWQAQTMHKRGQAF